MVDYEGFFHSLTNVAIYDEPYFAMIRKHTTEEDELLFDVIGVGHESKWTTYYLLERETHNNEKLNGRRTLVIPVPNDKPSIYNVGDCVAVGFSRKYKHFYIERRIVND